MDDSPGLVGGGSADLTSLSVFSSSIEARNSSALLSFLLFSFS